MIIFKIKNYFFKIVILCNQPFNVPHVPENHSPSGYDGTDIKAQNKS